MELVKCFLILSGIEAFKELSKFGEIERGISNGDQIYLELVFILWSFKI